MSRDTNLIVMTGRLTRDPEMKYSPDGKAICEFSIACNDTDEKVNFFDCQAWEKTAEIIGEHFKKGQKILINQGRFNQQRWDDKESGEKRQKYILKVFSFEFMGGKKDE